MIKKIAIVVVALIGAILIYAATKPDTFRVQRATSIKAPPEKIFALINDFHRWGSWSPWENLDPAMKRTYTGAPNGKGAVYAWEGNSKVGAGRMEIAEASPPSKVTIQLDFLEPIEGHNIAEFTLDAKGDSTNVTWAMHGPSPYVAKVMTIFFSMDNMVGKDFEQGLANLKTIAEK
ncbi:MAG: SRPBCC family protein [Candidatus Lambdaproteobacteria bacterium]|nr:SRPBCC family protein [Candidatus Lambdaproteobacteria bacterium]